MNYTAVIAVIISFGISAIACPAVIPFLKRLKFGQQIREEGPRDHRKKSGTPTMGGLAFLFSIVLTCLLFMREYPKIIPIMFVTLGFGIIGFLDDYIKVVMKRSEGLKHYAQNTDFNRNLIENPGATTPQSAAQTAPLTQGSLRSSASLA